MTNISILFCCPLRVICTERRASTTLAASPFTNCQVHAPCRKSTRGRGQLPAKGLKRSHAMRRRIAVGSKLGRQDTHYKNTSLLRTKSRGPSMDEQFAQPRQAVNMSCPRGILPLHTLALVLVVVHALSLSTLSTPRHSPSLILHTHTHTHTAVYTCFPPCSVRVD